MATGLEQLEEQSSTTRMQRSLKVWLAPSKVHPSEITDEGVLVLDCPNSMHQRFIKEFSTSCRLLLRTVYAAPITGLHARVSHESLRKHRKRVEQVDQALQQAPGTLRIHH